MNEEVEVKDEAKTEPVSEWLEPSPVGDEFMRHSAAMEPAARVPVHKAFAIAPGFNVGMLRKMAEAFRPKRIVVIDHGEQGFEVRRLAANDDVSLFYLSLNPEQLSAVTDITKPIEEQKTYMKNLFVEFFSMGDEAITRYDAQAVKLRESGCIGYALIQRKCASVATFRKDAEGSTAAIKKALFELETEGFLRKLSEEETNELFGTGATVYRINKGVL